MPPAAAGVPVVFLLIPVNVASSRRFSLFNAGGDYVAHVERAREIGAQPAGEPRPILPLCSSLGQPTTREERMLWVSMVTMHSAGFDACFTPGLATLLCPLPAQLPRGLSGVALWLCCTRGTDHFSLSRLCRAFASTQTRQVPARPGCFLDAPACCSQLDEQPWGSKQGPRASA